MKNMKIKTYSINKITSTDKKSGEIKLQPSEAQTTATSEVNKLIKSPSLNISSKLDSKGNRLIKINLFDKQVKNNILEINSKSNTFQSSSNSFSTNNKNFLHNSNYKYNSNNVSSHQARNPNNINIKLNFNSEIINNNIKVGKSENLTALNQIKSSLKDYVSPKNVKEKNTNQDTTKKPSQDHSKTLSYYSDVITEKDKLIENLRCELEETKLIISSLTQENLKLRNLSTLENQLSDSKKDTIPSSEKVLLNNSINKKEENNSTKEKIMSERVKNNLLFKTSLTSQTANFRKSNLNNLLDNSHFKSSSNKIYCPKDQKTIEDNLRSTAKLIEQNTISSIDSRFKSFSSQMNGDYKDAFKNLKIRTQKLLEKYSESIMKINNNN